jgi:dipeptide/tripeptide permease
MRKGYNRVLHNGDLEIIIDHQLTDNKLDVRDDHIKSKHNDDKDTSDNLLWPKACSYIIANEFGERFNYYGSKPLFAKYLTRFYGLNSTQVTVWTSANSFLTYFLPLFGGAISDSYLGKFWTIVTLSLLYTIGTVLLALFSIPGFISTIPSSLTQLEIKKLTDINSPLPGALSNNQISQFWTFIIPVVFIAIGAGGIKPCVSAHGGDQYLPNQKLGLDFFFSVFYIAINAGSLISGIISKYLFDTLAPFIRQDLQCFGAPCYFSAFVLCSCTFILSTIIFIIGKKHYRIAPPRGEFLPWTVVCLTYNASRKWLNARPIERNLKSNFLQFSVRKYGAELVNETLLVGNILAQITPLIFYFSLYDQGSNEWQFQYNMMRPSGIPVEGILKFQYLAFGNMNALFVLILIPLSVKFYSFLEKKKIRFSVLQRMGTGFTLNTIAYGISGIIQL